MLTVAFLLLLTVAPAVRSEVVSASSSPPPRSWPSAIPVFGALIASPPLVSILGMIWLWRDKPDVADMSAHVRATFRFVLPSLPMFVAVPAMPDRGLPFWVALVLGCVLAVALYGAMTWLGPRFGLRLW